MAVTIALAGNPNCGKTTMFNDLTGSSQYVGNWPGVTVEKKEGRLRGHRQVVIQDLPGIYSLSPYTPEEVVARDFLVKDRPDAIINILDGTNLQRNLYLTTQLLELGIPVVAAVNMMDLVRKSGDRIDLEGLGQALGCPVLEASALRGEGSLAAAEAAIRAAQSSQAPQSSQAAQASQDPGAGGCPGIFGHEVEEALSRIGELITPLAAPETRRWYAVKLFERDQRAMEELSLGEELKARLEELIRDCETRLDDDAESIITNQRYAYITGITHRYVRKNALPHSLTLSDRIDRVVTHRVLALPIFAIIMLLVYAIAMGGWSISIGSAAADWANDGLFGDGWFLSGGESYEALEGQDPRDYGVWIDGIPAAVEGWLQRVECADWLTGLIVEGIIGGVGAVLGFVPQLLVLFLLLSALEDVGYMARVAFIMDRVFRRFGLSGKSFIPMLIGTGCGVPGVMASRTIENQRDRRMTVMTTCFMPCGAKMPIIALFAGALFHGSAWVAASAYFLGVAAVVLSGIILKKTRAFAGQPAPFVMELPAYHIPAPAGLLRSAWERGWSFIKRAGTVILASSIVLWFLQGFGFVGGAFGMVEENSDSLLAAAGSAIAFVFAPLGFGSWQATVAAITGLIAKEEVVSTLGVLYPGDLSARIAGAFTPLAAYSFLIFNLLCAPCFAAMGAIRREMNDSRWTAAAIGYMCGFAYAVSLMVYQLGGLLTGETAFGPGTVAALAAAAVALRLLARRPPADDRPRGGAPSPRPGRGGGCGRGCRGCPHSF